MQIKSLEIMGFKSFSKKTRLDFGSGVTAIVGPNGSGKSNICDAIRWVLGEQRIKALRGSKMEDVIFSGSEEQRSLGMAEVQLTLDNSDGFLPVEYQEVVLTRRVYRSGESEFLLNKNPCRLKDIHDLLADTGLGKEGYAMISQGQVEQVLSANPMERRAIFDEAAGINKYQHRKAEAVRKMTAADADIQRLNDLLAELRERLGPLSQEAEKALTYERIATKLRHYELDLYSIRLRSNDKKLAALKAKQADVEHQLAEQTQTQKNLDAQMDSIQQQVIAVETEIDAAQDVLTELREQFGEADNREQLGQQRLRHLREKQDAGNKQLQVREARLEELLQKKAERKDEEVRLGNRQELAAEALAKEEADLNRLRRENHAQIEQVQTLKDTLMQLQKEMSRVDNLCHTYEQQKQYLQANSGRISERRAKLLQENETLDQGGEAAQERLNALLQLLQDAELQQGHEKEKYVRLQTVRDKKLETLANLQRQQSQLRSRHRALTDLEKDYEGYAFSVKKLMQVEQPAFSVIGTIADVIQVPEGLELAVEIALGAAVQNVLVPNRVDAEAAIAWLKQAKAGRATFLPLDSVKGNSFSKHSRKHFSAPGVLGQAMDLITCAPEHEAAVSSVLGRCIIVQDIATAYQLKNVLSSFHRIVTTDGAVVTPSGAITGGSVRTKGVGLLSRRNELEALTQRLKDIDAALTEAAKEKQDVVDQMELQQATLEESKAAVETAKQEQQQIRSRQEQLSVAQKQVQDQLNNLQQEQEEIRVETEKLDLQRKEQSALGQELSDEIAKVQEEIEAKELSLQGVIQHVDTVAAEHTQRRIEHAELVNASKGIQADMVRLTSEVERIQEEITQQTRDLRTDNKELQEIQAAVSQTVAAKEQCAQKQQQQGSLIDQLKQKRSQLRQRQDATSRQSKETVASLSKLERALHRTELDQSRYSLQIEQIEDELQMRKANSDEVRSRPVEQDAKSLQGVTQEYREKIEKLGSINPGSVSEYEEVQQRCEFLQVQISDLTEAKQGLQKLIGEMDALSKEKLVQAIAKVRLEFAKVFKRLFKGGKADLVLTDKDDPLASGIDILAQLPGKHMQNLVLLSGGERSLIAASLLFAILYTKPAVFCVLDEIDAALDAANLSRFSELTTDLAATTQLLLITHRQTTMESADVLYGVTMTSQSVSQLMSVKLATVAEGDGAS